MRVKKGPVSRTAVYAAAIAVALSAAFYFFFLPLVQKKAGYRLRLSGLKGEIASKQNLHRGLRREQRMLEEEDSGYLEKYARDNFGWAREEEIIYKLEKE